MLILKDKVQQFLKILLPIKEKRTNDSENNISFDRLITLISINLEKFPEFDYYIPIIEKAKENEVPHPDIAIECCNSLVQGISKTVVLRLDPTADKEKLDKSRSENSTDAIFKRALNCIKENDDVYEEDFVRRGVSLAFAISTLRNARGDISHGRAVPKELQSNRELARVVMEMTASLLRYTLASFYIIEFDRASDELEEVEIPSEKPETDLLIVNYEGNEEFNNYLDDQYALDGKVIYSKALYELYYEDYLLQLDEYQYEQEVY